MDLRVEVGPLDALGELDRIRAVIPFPRSGRFRVMRAMRPSVS